MQYGFPSGKMTETYRRMEHYYALAQWSACPLQRWRYENLMMVEVRRFLDWSRKEQTAILQTLQQNLQAEWPNSMQNERSSAADLRILTPPHQMPESLQRVLPPQGNPVLDTATESALFRPREMTPPTADQVTAPKAFTLAELAQFDGAGGRPAYVAVDRVVYDVSREATWGGATHFGLYAGRDLTLQFAGCHGKAEVLRNLPRVGVLV